MEDASWVIVLCPVSVH